MGLVSFSLPGCRLLCSCSGSVRKNPEPERDEHELEPGRENAEE
jgi:hypothetical protein